MDTITIVSDTLAVKFKAATDICQPCIEGTGTNWSDILVVLILCVCVGVISITGICMYYNNKKEERVFLIKNNMTPNHDVMIDEHQKGETKYSTDEVEYKREIERQKRILNLMQEICTLSQEPGSSRDIKGKYNNEAANKLWDLYQKIDSYHKSYVNSSSNINEQQNGKQ